MAVSFNKIERRKECTQREKNYKYLQNKRVNMEVSSLERKKSLPPG